MCPVAYASLIDQMVDLDRITDWQFIPDRTAFLLDSFPHCGLHSLGR
jgi:hypothetical protein